MKKAKKYYVVWQGRKTGVFTTWEECQQQIHQFSGAKYKSFPTKKEAELAFNQGAVVNQTKSNPQKTPRSIPKNYKLAHHDSNSIIPKSICVDASCLGNPGILEYQGVDTASGNVLFRQGPMADGTNNIGEFLAIVHGLAYLQKKRL
jgi:ribonuclease HI